MHTPQGKRVPVQLSDPHQAAGLHTGMQVQVTGQWLHSGQQPQAGPQQKVVRTAAGSSSGDGGSSDAHFAATSIRASGSTPAGPVLTIERAAGPTAGAGSSSGKSAAAAAASAAVYSRNKLMSSDINAIFIPSEAGGQTGEADRQPGNQAGGSPQCCLPIVPARLLHWRARCVLLCPLLPPVLRSLHRGGSCCHCGLCCCSPAAATPLAAAPPPCPAPGATPTPRIAAPLPSAPPLSLTPLQSPA